MTADQLNEILDTSVFGQFLSPAGRRMFFPLGIVAQAQEAAERGSRIKATAGVALSKGHYMTHDLFHTVSDNPDNLVAYAPTAGLTSLRNTWDEHICASNPRFAATEHSLPVVTSGLTHSITIMASLFVTEGQKVVTLNPSWDNYDLIFSTSKGADLIGLPLFDENNEFAVTQWKQQLQEIKEERILCIFNFPNNPIGYTPSDEQMKEIAQMLYELAEKGKKFLIVTDDAYYGLFHDESCAPFSLADYLVDLHENIGVIKCDAATKESLVWGFRVGFITFAGKNLRQEHLDALVEKVKGSVRTSISSCAMISQSLLLEAMSSPGYSEKLSQVKEVMKKRLAVVRQAVAAEGVCEGITPIPSNSGYFSSFRVEKDAYELRRILLEKDIAVITIDEHLIRIAYSALEEEDIAPVIHALYEGVRNQ